MRHKNYGKISLTKKNVSTTHICIVVQDNTANLYCTLYYMAMVDSQCQLFSVGVYLGKLGER